MGLRRGRGRVRDPDGAAARVAAVRQAAGAFRRAAGRRGGHQLRVVGGDVGRFRERARCGAGVGLPRDPARRVVARVRRLSARGPAHRARRAGRTSAAGDAEGRDRRGRRDARLRGRALRGAVAAVAAAVLRRAPADVDRRADADRAALRRDGARRPLEHQVLLPRRRRRLRVRPRDVRRRDAVPTGQSRAVRGARADQPDHDPARRGVGRAQPRVVARHRGVATHGVPVDDAARRRRVPAARLGRGLRDPHHRRHLGRHPADDDPLRRPARPRADPVLRIAARAPEGLHQQELLQLSLRLSRGVAEADARADRGASRRGLRRARGARDREPRRGARRRALGQAGPPGLRAPHAMGGAAAERRPGARGRLARALPATARVGREPRRIPREGGPLRRPRRAGLAGPRRRGVAGHPADAARRAVRLHRAADGAHEDEHRLGGQRPAEDGRPPGREHAGAAATRTARCSSRGSSSRSTACRRSSSTT